MRSEFTLLAFAAILFASVVSATCVSFATETSSPRFVLHGADVLDRQTGLTWQRCSFGQRWDGRHCAGNARVVWWRTAMTAGHDGWRLPTVAELETLIDEGRKRGGELPTLDPTVFPDLPHDVILRYWTSERQQRPGETPKLAAMTVDFATTTTDEVDWYQLGSLQPVRLVRGTANSTAMTPARSGPVTMGNFTINGDTALDARTGLLWQRCNAGQQIVATGACGGVARQFTMSQLATVGHDGWRLPTLDELKTLIDTRHKSKPFIDTTVFPVGQDDPQEYWSSTPYGSSETERWCLSFAIAYRDNCGANPGPVRLVKSAK